MIAIFFKVIEAIGVLPLRSVMNGEIERASVFVEMSGVFNFQNIGQG